MIGETILHYKILEKIGEGGMGIVYKAQDTKLQRTVALKFLSEDVIREKEAKERFIREARSASKLDHPNICTIYAVEEVDDQLFIAMAYYEGKTLQEVIDKGPMKIDEVLTITNKIADGLNEAHSKGIIHRDIKPSNIMLTDRGQVIIMDFGLAKSIAGSMVTKAGTTLGTIGFMSPEQSRGEDVDSRTDIWSLGVVLYYMLTGQTPFKGEYEQAVIYSIVNVDPEPITGIRTGVPVELETYIGKCLKKSAEERYPTVSGLIVDLKNLKKDTSRITQVSEPIKPPDTVISQPDTKKDTTVTITLTSKSKKLVMGIAAAVVIAGAFGVLKLLPGEAPPELVENRVAVAYFENETGDESFDYLKRRIADNLTNDLGAIQTAEIMPLVSDNEYDDKEGIERLREIANITGSQYIVSGVIYKQGNDLLIEPRVTNISTGEILNGLPDVTGPGDDPLLVMELLRKKVMGAVYAVNSPTYDEFYKFMDYVPEYEALVEMEEGIKLFNSRNYIESIEFSNRSMEIDPGFLKPLLFISVAYGNVGRYAEADSVLRLAEDKREQLSAYDRQHFVWYRASLDGDLTQSLATQRDLTETNPSNVNFYLIGLAANEVNNVNEAEDALARIDKESEWAQDWEPFWNVYGNTLHLLEKHQEQLEIALEQRTIFTESGFGLFRELIARIGLGEIGQVMDQVDGFFTLGGIPGNNLRSIAQELFVHGYPTEARVVNDKAIKWYLSRPEEEFLSLREALFEASYFSLFVIEVDQQFPAGIEQENVTGTIGQTRDARIEEQRRIINDLESEDPDDQGIKVLKGMLAAQTGDLDTAQEMFNWLGDLDGKYIRGSNIYRQAAIAAALGEKSRAVTLLQDAFRNGSTFGTNFHRYYPFYPLHGFPEFEEFMKPKN